MKKTNVNKKSVSEILSDTIINLLEQENGDHNNPFWLEKPELAVNTKSGRYYTGLNKFMLSPIVRKYNDNRFLTFNEIKEMGGSVTKDEKGHIVYFSTHSENKIEFNSLQEQCLNCQHTKGRNCICQLEENQIWQSKQAQLSTDKQELCTEYTAKETLVSKYYKVWNVRQTNLIEKGILPEKDGRKNIILNEVAAKSILMGLEITGLRIKASIKPNYDFETNTVSLAGLPAFKGDKGIYYASMMKQLAFAVGAGEKYLNLSYMKADKDGSNPQMNLISYGNLVAEMAASIIASELGINYKIKRDIEYIIPLIKKIRTDSRFIIMASNSANKIAQYILAIGEEYRANNKSVA